MELENKTDKDTRSREHLLLHLIQCDSQSRLFLLINTYTYSIIYLPKVFGILSWQKFYTIEKFADLSYLRLLNMYIILGIYF